MDTTAAPTDQNPLVKFLRDQLLPVMIARKGKLYGVTGPEIPEAYLARSNRQNTVSAEVTADLLALPFVQHLSVPTRKSFEEKVGQGYFARFTAQGSPAKPFMSSDQGKELVGNLIKAFYGAFPFLQKRRVVLSLRDLSINIMTTVKVENAFLPDHLSAALDEFNNSVSYFHASATAFYDSTSMASNERQWMIKVTCHTRNLRNGTTGHTDSFHHPAFKAATLTMPLCRKVNASNQFSDRDDIHLNPYLIKDTDKVYTFLKSLLEHLPCKTVS